MFDRKAVSRFEKAAFVLEELEFELIDFGIGRHRWTMIGENSSLQPSLEDFGNDQK